MGAFQTPIGPGPGPGPSPRPAPGPGPGAIPGHGGAAFNANELALDALLVADGLLTQNAFFVSRGLQDYSNILGTMVSSSQAQAQFYRDFFIDFLFLRGAAQLN
jgi:hypothetical protein